MADLTNKFALPIKKKKKKTEVSSSSGPDDVAHLMTRPFSPTDPLDQRFRSTHVYYNAKNSLRPKLQAQNRNQRHHTLDIFQKNHHHTTNDDASVMMDESNITDEMIKEIVRNLVPFFSFLFKDLVLMVEKFFLFQKTVTARGANLEKKR